MTTSIDPLLAIDPTNYTTGIAYIRALIHGDPSLCLERWMRIIKYHKLDELRGYSRARYYDAVREWRRAHGYPPMGATTRENTWIRPVNSGSPTEATEPTQNGSTGSPVRLPGATVAELVWEWMDENGYEDAFFWGNGEVTVRKKEKARKREYRIAVEGEEA